VIPRFDVSGLYSNGTLDLGQFFQGLQKEAGILKISQLKLAPSKKTLQVISIESIKNIATIIEYIKSSATQAGDHHIK